MSRLMRTSITPFLTFAFYILSSCAYANDSAFVNIQIQARLTSPKVNVQINDGINDYFFEMSNVLEWKGRLSAPFGYIAISYTLNDTSIVQKKYFFRKGNSLVDLLLAAESLSYLKFNEIDLVNIVPYAQMGGEEYDSFIRDEYNARKQFLFMNLTSTGTDSVWAHLEKLTEQLTKKKVEFIKVNPHLYISFWVFTHEVVKTDILKPDSLARFYQNHVSDKYKRGGASEYVERLIQNKIAISSYGHFPSFATKDANSNPVNLEGLKGKYVLIQFWASWCIPCLQEVPDLKSINLKYKMKDFSLISFSIDESKRAFESSVKKHEMDWSVIFGDKDVYRALGVTPIPQVYLLDKTGHVIYNMTKANDHTLILLKKTLYDLFGY